MRTQNLEWLERFALDRSFQLCQAPVGSLWHRCCKCPASAEFRHGYCQDFNLDKGLHRMPLSGVAGVLWTRLMPADPPYGQDVPKPIRHEHVVVWELHSESGELDTRGFGDGSLRHGRMKRLVRGGWRLAVMDELHGPFPGLHQVWYLRQRDGRHFLHGLLERASLLDERPGVQHQRGSSSTRRPGDESGSASTRSVHISFRLEWVKGHATMQHVRAGTISLWQLQANELVDEQGKKGSALHLGAAQVEPSYSARASFLGWLVKFLGRLHA